ncbi:unnamed protein product [Gongylonema pulchrum]|uniref:Porin n=1 Tax=Gongylonema pulchrum TaxID=637853 RepID=A0A183DB76_9BILA|nr:unnamed protein product [Gongylonema pulchrum]
MIATKHLRLSEDVLWGQSLHFDLDADTSKYLNVSVRAKPTSVYASTDQDSDTLENTTSQMLGYVSFY